MPKNTVLSIQQKGHLFTTRDLGQEGRTLPYSISAGNVRMEWLKVFTTFCVYADDCENATNSDLGFENKFQGVGEFANMKFMNNKACLYVKFWK